VLASDEVLVLKIVVNEPGDSIYDFVANVGWFSGRAKEDKFLVVRGNAEALRP
jgi:hypothetical protein